MEILKGIAWFLAGLAMFEVLAFLRWRLWKSNEPCRFQHYTENERIKRRGEP